MKRQVKLRQDKVKSKHRRSKNVTAAKLTPSRIETVEQIKELHCHLCKYEEISQTSLASPQENRFTFVRLTEYERQQFEILNGTISEPDAEAEGSTTI